MKTFYSKKMLIFEHENHYCPGMNPLNVNTYMALNRKYKVGCPFDFLIDKKTFKKESLINRKTFKSVIIKY